ARGVASLSARACDVIAVVGGGGARTDLAAFDDEQVARVIALAPVPVITGIGHEIDRSIADEVAHTSAKTPTATARLLVAHVTEQAGRVEEMWSVIARLSQRGLAAHDAALLERAQRTHRSVRAALATVDDRLSRQA